MRASDLTETLVNMSGIESINMCDYFMECYDNALLFKSDDVKNMDGAPRDHSNDSIATSEEYEVWEPKSHGLLEVEDKVLIIPTEKPSPEMEIGNHGNLDYLQESLNEVLDEESSNRGTILSFIENLIHLLTFSTGTYRSNTR